MTTVTFVQRFFLFRELRSGNPTGKSISFTVPEPTQPQFKGDKIELQAGGETISGEIAGIFRKPQIQPSGQEFILYDRVEIDVETA